MNTESDDTLPEGLDEEPIAPEPFLPITVSEFLRAIFLPPIAAPSDKPKDGPPPPDETPSAVPDPALLTLLQRPQITYPKQSDSALSSLPRKQAMLAAIGLLLAMLIAYGAQSLLATGEHGIGAALLYAVAIAIWVAALLVTSSSDNGQPLTYGPRIDGGPGYAPLRLFDRAEFSLQLTMAGLAAALSVAAYVLNADNTFTVTGVVTWLASIVTWLIVAAERSPLDLIERWHAALPELRERLRGLIRPPSRETITLLIIVAVAAFFRLYRLDATPAEMTSDHVEKILDSLGVAQGRTQVFFTNNGGREAIQFYLIPLAARLFGTGFTFHTLKLVSVIEGLLLIPTVVLLGRRLIDRPTGLLAAALIAVSWWDVMLSRLALRIALTPLVFTLILVTLIRGVHTGSRRAWLWAGVWMGVGVYSYQALRMTPLVAVAAFLVSVAGPVWRAVVASIRDSPDAPLRLQVANNTTRRQVVNLMLSGVVAFAIFVPMLRVWHDYPDKLWNRVVNRVTDAEQQIERQPTAVFAENYRHALGMFNVSGDRSWISSVNAEPVLDRAAGALFLLGVAAWVLRLIKRHDPADAFILLAGLIMLLPSALAIAFPIENPSTTRASGTLPIAFLFAAWPLTLTARTWRATLGNTAGTALAGLVIAAGLLASALQSFGSYFHVYDASYRAAALNPSEVAQAVRQEIGIDAPLDGVWLIGWPYWHDYRAIGIEAGEPTFRNALIDTNVLREYLTTVPAMFSTRPLVFIVHPDDTETLDLLEGEFPTGAAHHFAGSDPNHDFVLYLVP